MAQRQTFMQAFNPYLQNTANMWSRHFLQQGEDERERQRQLKESKKQNNILSQLVSGTKPTFNYAGKFSPLVQQQAPLNQQDYVNLSSGASDDTLQRYNFIKEMTKQPEKKQKKTVTIGNQIFEESPDYENVPTGNPLFNLPEKPKEPKTEYIDSISIGDGKKIQRGGYEVDESQKNELNVIEKEVNGKKRYYKITSQSAPQQWYKTVEDGNGNRYNQLSPEVQKDIKSYSDKIKDFKAKLEAVKQGNIVYDITPFGFKTVVSEKDLKDNIASTRAQYKAYLEDNVGSDTKNWLDGFNQEVNPLDPNYAPTYWATLKEDFKNKEIDVSTYQELQAIFDSEFDKNPFNYFGQ